MKKSAIEWAQKTFLLSFFTQKWKFRWVSEKEWWKKKIINSPRRRSWQSKVLFMLILYDFMVFSLNQHGFLFFFFAIYVAFINPLSPSQPTTDVDSAKKKSELSRLKKRFFLAFMEILSRVLHAEWWWNSGPVIL